MADLPELRTFDLSQTLGNAQMNALRGMQMQKMQQEERDQNALRALVSNAAAQGGDPTAQRRAIADAYIKTGRPEFIKLGSEIHKQLDEGPFSKVDAEKFTPESLMAFSKSRNYSDLVPVRKKEIVNLGGVSQAVDPYNIAAGASLAHTMTPGETARLNWDQFSWANLSPYQKQRLENEIRQLGISEGNLSVNQGNLGVNRSRLWYETGLGGAAVSGGGLKAPGVASAPSMVPSQGGESSGLTPKAKNDALAAFTKEQLDSLVKNYTENNPKFTGGISAINQARDALESGMYNGKFSQFKMDAAKTLKAALPDALIPADFDKKVANTETYSAATGQLVLNIIKNLGSGSGISDADREYAAKIVGGQISLDERTMPRLLDIAERGIRGQAKAHNSNVDAATSKGFAPLGNIKFELPERAQAAPADDWLTRAMKANPDKTREQVEAYGRRIGKIK